MSDLHICHVELKEANAFVDAIHRHHDPVTGHRFSIGVKDSEDNLIGVAIVGRPVARNVNWREVLEVTRLATTGAKNACSFLYAAAARAGKELGYKKIQTYILSSEPGVTLRAAGWEKEADVKGRPWKHTQGKRKNSHPLEDKERWAKQLND